MSNKDLVEKLQETIIQKFKKRKVHSSFKDNISCGRSSKYEIKQQI